MLIKTFSGDGTPDSVSRGKIILKNDEIDLLIDIMSDALYFFYGEMEPELKDYFEILSDDPTMKVIAAFEGVVEIAEEIEEEEKEDSKDSEESEEEDNETEEEAEGEKYEVTSTLDLDY